MTFWITTIALALIISAFLGFVLTRRRQGEDADEPAAAYDLKIYRDQLRDIDRDLARGVISEDDAGPVRVEISRRILAADARVQAAGGADDDTGAQGRMMAAVLMVVLVAGSAGMYMVMGAPGYGDLGLDRRVEMANLARENRPDQADAEARIPAAPAIDLDPGYVALIKQLREKVAANPDDLQGQILLSRHEARSGDFAAAHRAQARVIDLMGDTVTSRQYAEYGELLIVAANGYVSPEAEEALRTALEMDPRDGPSRYYWGLMLGQIGRPDLAFRVWEGTLRQGPPDAPWLNPIRDSIEEMAWRAGVNNYTLPDAPASAPPLAGPSAGDVAAASDMSEEDRQQMIRSMVERLSGRLASEGGSPAEWARLITALGILGDTTRAQTIFDEAKTVFADNDDALGEINSAAQKVGLGG
jgi:cytochrome c-type biogenesis protein CcmH